MSEEGSKGLDDTDHALLHELQHNARMSIAELARRVQLSASPCQRRLRRLERSGIIRGYTVVLDPDVTQTALVAFVGVRLTNHSRPVVQQFQREVVQLPGVRECHHVAGAYDYLLRVEVADLPAYETFHSQDLAALSGIAHVTTFFSMEDVKATASVGDAGRDRE